MRILWRRRVLVGAGAAVAICLAVLSAARVSPTSSPHIAYRQDEQWVSYSTLFVTQQGFPWGRNILDTTSPAQEARTKQSEKLYADPSRFSSLAVLYSRLATSDQVRAIMLKKGPIDGEIDAAPVLASANAFADALPLVQIAAIAKTPTAAIKLVEGTTQAFRQFLERQQQLNAIPSEQRVIVTVIKRADKPKLLAGRSMTLPIVVFMIIMLLVCGIAFVLENWRPKIEAAPVPVEDELRPAPLDAARRTA